MDPNKKKGDSSKRTGEEEPVSDDGGDPDDGEKMDTENTPHESDTTHTTQKGHKRDKVEIPNDVELQLFQWLLTKPQIWNKNRMHQNFEKVKKLALFQEVAGQYGRTGQFFKILILTLILKYKSAVKFC